MAIDSYSTQKTYIDANINTNGVGSISGAIANVALALYILKNQPTLVYDTTRDYLVGQVCVYNDGTRYNIYYCTTAYTAGAFDNTKWTRINQIKEVLTTNNNSYAGIEVGSNVFAHTLATADFTIDIKDSSGASIPVEIVTARDTTTITIVSLAQYSGAKLTIIE